MRIDKTKLRVAMAYKDWNIGQLATATGLHRNTVARLVRHGGVCELPTLERLGAALGIAPLSLLTDNDHNPTPGT